MSEKIIPIDKKLRDRMDANMRNIVELICEADCAGKKVVKNPYHYTEPEHSWYRERANFLGVIAL